jgi:hypothetical protein
LPQPILWLAYLVLFVIVVYVVIWLLRMLGVPVG